MEIYTAHTAHFLSILYVFVEIKMKNNHTDLLISMPFCVHLIMARYQCRICVMPGHKFKLVNW